MSYSIYYHTEPTQGLGLNPPPHTWEGAIRLTSAELIQCNKCYLTNVSFFLWWAQTDLQGAVKIYDEGVDSSHPGSLLQETAFEVTGWQTYAKITLDSPVEIDKTRDMWISIEVIQTTENYIIGCDNGPQVDGKGGWVYEEGSIDWIELQDVGLDINFCIKAGFEGFTVTIDTAVYTQGSEHRVELEIDANTSEKASLDAVLQNAGKVGRINAPLADIQHYDTTIDGSNTVTFNINDNPIGVPDFVTLFIENYSFQVISPEPIYKFKISGYSE